MARWKKRGWKQQKGKMKSSEYEREPLLNRKRVGIFKYEIREILGRTKLDENTQATMIASIIAKASRVGIEEAKDYVEAMAEDLEGLDYESRDDIYRLLDRFTKYR